ncbi:MAG TPA: GIY-YIG nuclease family protein [Cellvibrionaceae bacterium]
MWYTYIIKSDTNQLYTGITTDIERRWQEHSEGPKGARFFRTCKPLQLCRLEAFADRSGASRREAAIKKLTRREKEQLITSVSPVDLPALPQADYAD